MQKINSLAQIHALLLKKEKYAKIVQRNSKFEIQQIQLFTSQIGTAQQESLRKQVMQVSLKNVMNTQFTGKLTIGKPPQSFDLIFDSGSQNLIVNSMKCKNQGCQIADQFDCKLSKTCNETPITTEFYFGSGILQAQFTQDQVCIDKLCIDNTPFYQIISQQGEIFEQGSFDGIAGLGLTMAEDQTPSFFDFLVQKNVLFQNVFSVYLSNDEDTFSSQLILGGVDTRFTTDLVSYYPVIDDNYWAIKIDKIMLGNGLDTNLCSEEKKCVAILDTGTSLMTGSEKSLISLLKFFNENVEHADDCSYLSTYPDLVFVIGGKNYSLQASEYILSIDQYGNEYMYEHPEQNEIVQCAAAFSSLDIDKFEDKDINAWILGDIFISKFYTIFDRQNNQIGLAKSIN